MKRLAMFAASAALVAAGACGSSGSKGGSTTLTKGSVVGSPGMTASVTAKNIAFSPATVRIAKGGTVTWHFDDGATPHNVTAEDSSWKSDNETSGTFAHTFNSAGTYKYSCTIHPSMKGTVVVS
jgi:plastocyanin